MLCAKRSIWLCSYLPLIYKLMESQFLILSVIHIYMEKLFYYIVIIIKQNLFETFERAFHFRMLNIRQDHHK